MKIAHLPVDSISPPDVYKLLTNVVMPRPIAWVTSRNENGNINLAPFSFFNAFGAFPPIVAIGVGNESDGLPKHTGRNILRDKEFVVNLVTPDLIDQMTISAADFPAGESELEAAGLHAVASAKISVPRVGEARVSLECVLHSHQRIGAVTGRGDTHGEESGERRGHWCARVRSR